MTLPKLSAAYNNCSLHGLSPEIKGQILFFAENSYYDNGYKQGYELLKACFAETYKLQEPLSWKNLANILSSYNSWDTQIILGHALRKFMNKNLSNKPDIADLAIAEGLTSEEYISSRCEMHNSGRFLSLEPSEIGVIAQPLGLHILTTKDRITTNLAEKEGFLTINLHHFGRLADGSGHWERTEDPKRDAEDLSNKSQFENITLLAQRGDVEFSKKSIELLTQHVMLTAQSFDNPNILNNEIPEQTAKAILGEVDSNPEYGNLDVILAKINLKLTNTNKPTILPTPAERSAKTVDAIKDIKGNFPNMGSAELATQHFDNLKAQLTAIENQELQSAIQDQLGILEKLLDNRIKILDFYSKLPVDKAKTDFTMLTIDDPNFSRLFEQLYKVDANFLLENNPSIEAQKKLLDDELKILKELEKIDDNDLKKLVAKLKKEIEQVLEPKVPDNKKAAEQPPTPDLKPAPQPEPEPEPDVPEPRAPSLSSTPMPPFPPAGLGEPKIEELLQRGIVLPPKPTSQKNLGAKNRLLHKLDFDNFLDEFIEKRRNLQTKSVKHRAAAMNLCENLKDARDNFYLSLKPYEEAKQSFQTACFKALDEAKHLRKHRQWAGDIKAFLIKLVSVFLTKDAKAKLGFYAKTHSAREMDKFRDMLSADKNEEKPSGPK